MKCHVYNLYINRLPNKNLKPQYQTWETLFWVAGQGCPRDSQNTQPIAVALGYPPRDGRSFPIAEDTKYFRTGPDSPELGDLKVFSLQAGSHGAGGHMERELYINTLQLIGFSQWYLLILKLFYMYPKVE